MNVPQHLREARRRAAIASIAVSLPLEFATVWLMYGHFRAYSFAPAITDYLLLLVVLPMYPGFFLVAFFTARYQMNRCIPYGLHIKMTLFVIAAALASAEAWIGSQEIALMRAPPAEGEWTQRIFPFTGFSILYMGEEGWHVND